MNVTEEAERERQARMIGLYLGPMVLASVLAGGIYRSVCSGRPFMLGSVFGDNSAVSIMFALGASLLAWKLRDRWGKLAFAVLAVQQVMLASGTVAQIPGGAVLIGSLSIAFAILVTLSGVPTQTKWRVIVPAVFIAMFIFRWVTVYYADGIIGRHSVFRSGPFC